MLGIDVNHSCLPLLSLPPVLLIALLGFHHGILFSGRHDKIFRIGSPSDSDFTQGKSHRFAATYCLTCLLLHIFDVVLVTYTWVLGHMVREKFVLALTTLVSFMKVTNKG